MAAINVQPQQLLDRILSLEIVRVTERAAVSAARLRGRGNEMAADQAAVDAMRRELNKLPIRGTVVIGEGERDETPMLFIGELVGLETATTKVDIAVDPLDGTTLCAKSLPGAIATMAMAEQGTLLNAPDVYMEKIAIGPGYPRGLVDLDAPPEENIAALAKAKGVPPANITALVLDRPRHADLIAALRKAGAAVRLFTDGDTAGVIHTADAEGTGVDIYLGSGGAPEGVLAAAALRCIGGQMQGRLVLDTDAQEVRDGGHGPRRLPVRRDRRDRRPDAARGEIPQARHRDRDRGDALRHRHRALDPRRAPRPRQVPFGLRRGSKISALTGRTPATNSGKRLVSDGRQSIPLPPLAAGRG